MWGGSRRGEGHLPPPIDSGTAGKRTLQKMCLRSIQFSWLSHPLLSPEAAWHVAQIALMLPVMPMSAIVQRPSSPWQAGTEGKPAGDVAEGDGHQSGVVPLAISWDFCLLWELDVLHLGLDFHFRAGSGPQKASLANHLNPPPARYCRITCTTLISTHRLITLQAILPHMDGAWKGIVQNHPPPPHLQGSNEPAMFIPAGGPGRHVWLKAILLLYLFPAEVHTDKA